MALSGLFKSRNQDRPINLKRELRKLVKQKKYDEALAVGRKILAKTPHDNDVSFVVGGIYYMRDRPRDAIPFFEQALAIGEYDTHVLILKANAHHTLGQAEESRLCCQKILEVDPKNRGAADLLEKLSGRPPG